MYNISSGCLFQMKSANYNKKRTTFDSHVTLYAYCGHNFSTSFKLKIFNSTKSNSKVVKVYTNQAVCSHPSKKTRNLSGDFRTETKSQLLHTNPKLVRLQTVQEAKEEGKFM